MRFRRKKGDGEEEVSGEVVPETSPDPSTWALPADAGVTADEDTVDMEAVAPATAAGGAGRTDDHGERTSDDSTTILEQATGEDGPGAEPAAVASEDWGDDAEKLSRKERKAREKAEREAADRAAVEEAREREEAEAVAAGEEADRLAEEARLADEEADRAAAAELEARRAEQEAAKAAEKARAEAEASQRAQEAAEAAAAAQREADKRARKEAAEARDAAAAAAAAGPQSVSGASITSPGLGGDASPRAAAAANADAPRPATETTTGGGGGGGGGQGDAGPLAPVLAHPAVQKKPELLVVGGLAAGFVVAKILKAITSPDA